MKPFRSRPVVDLDGRVVAVTGAARGIGFATAQACAAAGMRVAIGDLDGDLAQRAAASMHGKAIGLSVDVSSKASFADFLDRTQRELGTLSTLINNAGVFHAGRFHEEPDEITERLIATNIGGAVTGTKLALQYFLPRDDGHIVNVASIGATIASGHAATYVATKHAILGLTRSLRLELAGSGIRTTAVLPGVVSTEMTAPLAPPHRFAPKALSPESAANLIIGALRSGRQELFIPGSMATAARVLGVLGPRTGDALKLVTGFDRMVTDRDMGRDADYERRVAAEHPM